MNVADAREEMMLNLEIQAAKKPAEDAASTSKIDGRLNLVNGPVGLHAFTALSVRHRHGKFSFFDAVRQLEYNAEHDTADECGDRINSQHRQHRMQQHRDGKRQREEDDFS